MRTMAINLMPIILVMLVGDKVKTVFGEQTDF